MQMYKIDIAYFNGVSMERQESSSFNEQLMFFHR